MVVGAAAPFPGQHRTRPTRARVDPAAVLPHREARRPGTRRRIARLAEGTGLSIEGVYRMDLSQETVKGNAMLAGLGRTRACCWAIRS